MDTEIVFGCVRRRTCQHAATEKAFRFRSLVIDSTLATVQRTKDHTSQKKGGAGTTPAACIYSSTVSSSSTVLLYCLRTSISYRRTVLAATPFPLQRSQVL